QVLAKAVRLGGRTGKTYPTIHDPQSVLGNMRLIKSSEEIEIIKKACRASALAHKEIIATIKPSMNERQVSGQIDYLFQKNGCQRLGYPSIVASGFNATCLHYRNNDQECKDQTLMLLDAGGEFDYYTADITRTYPIGASFTKEQEELYDIVLSTQKKCIEKVKPGANYVDLQNFTVDALTDGMIALGLVKEDKKKWIEEKKYMSYYPHNLGHWLGMDVHDTGDYYVQGEAKPFEPGMVLTIEPGIYIHPTDTTFPEKYRGIGIRIEDDVLVTKDGCEVLTKDAPKEKSDILQLKK
ncbi:MAG: Xaa-Pro dipeptidase, partial [Bdellovibrionales bacterium]|nr:Xaa-Pro dipeptidase [Bdellovibrionales bacterium]